jgi:hypothetical protein
MEDLEDREQQRCADDERRFHASGHLSLIAPAEFGLPAGRYTGSYPWSRRGGRNPRLVALAATPRFTRRPQERRGKPVQGILPWIRRGPESRVP